MSTDAKSLFHAALEQPSESERAKYLDSICGDTPLRRRVEALLRAHGGADPFLDRPAAEHLAAAENTIPLDFLERTDRTGALGRLGHYDILEVVGQGGMGIVFRAFDAKLHRVVAIKALVPILALHAPTRQRFLREARTAAAVVHDHIVPIHAVEEAGPVPYIVMQFVQGCTLQDKIDRTGPLPLAEVLRIGHQTALGLDAAHRQGVIHRDVKPANILLENGIERVRITDFGLARTTADASVTRSGVIAGTPDYMSPEQADGKPLDCRSDLFSLGSVLFAMCSGDPPFRADSAMAVLRRVCDEPPPVLSEVNPSIPSWFSAIVTKLQAKNPADRFATAGEVADVLSRELAQLQSGDIPSAKSKGTPVRPRLRLLFRGAAMTLLVAAAAITAWFVVKGPNDGRELTKETPTGLPAMPALPSEPVALKPAKTLTGHSGGVLVVAFSPNGKVLASAGEDRTIRLWDLTAGTSRSLPMEHVGDVVGLAFSPDGSRLTTVSSREDSCCVRLWDVASGKQTATLGGQNSGMWGGHWSPDGSKVASAGWDGTLRVWDVATGENHIYKENVCTRLVRGLAYSPQGDWIVTGGNGPTRLWDARTGEEVMTPEPMPEMCPTFLPTGVSRAGIIRRAVCSFAISPPERSGWPGPPTAA